MMVSRPTSAGGTVPIEVRPLIDHAANISDDHHGRQLGRNRRHHPLRAPGAGRSVWFQLGVILGPERFPLRPSFLG